MIRVHTADGPVEYASGQSYHVDEDGRLHVRGNTKGNIAAFATGAWDYVETTNTTTR